MKFKVLLLSVLVFGAYSVHAQSVITKRKAQTRRIVHGVKSGDLTRPEAKKLAKREANLRRTEARMRRSGGVFTKRERVILHHKRQLASRGIYQAKHNHFTR